MAAFPSFDAERSLTIDYDNNVVTDYLDSGAPRQRFLGYKFVTITAEFKYLSLTDKNTLVTWLTTNRAALVTWTIDGIDYSGHIIGNHSETMIANKYTVRLTYRAEEV